MNKILKLIYSNKFFAFIMLIIQIVIIVLGYIWLNEYSFVQFNIASRYSADNN